MTSIIDTDTLDLTAGPAVTSTGNTASAKQIELINRLKGERDLTGKDATRALALGREQWRLGTFTTGHASTLIEALLAAPRTTVRSTSTGPAPEGMHQVGPNIFKVQRSPQTGRLYAKRLDGRGDAETGETSWRFVYAPGALRDLSEDTLMTLEAAKEFGAHYGTCCVCARVLTNEKSIAEGIGPVCKSRM